MKQPELGKKIAEARKAKGLTQEELVEKCNISVRTIQRIEGGEVTPRSYTLRTIFAALDYDYEQVFKEALEENSTKSESEPTSKKWYNGTVELQQTNGQTVSQLNMCWMFGLIYFVLTFPEAIAEYFRFKDGDLIFSNTTYIILKIVLLLSFLMFQRGFVLMGQLLDVYFLRIAALVHMIAYVLIISYDISSLYFPLDKEIAVVVISITFGVMAVLFGFALMQLPRSMGRLPKITAGFKLLAACFFMSVFLFPLGDVLNAVAELFQIVLLIRAVDLVRKSQQLTFSRTEVA